MVHAERILFVHAHPDDETIDTGGTIATLIEAGAEVTVLTCTRGERGEVIPSDLKSALQSPAAMAKLRDSELQRAMTILGVSDHRYLGDETARWRGRELRTYLDSGMRWGADGPEAVTPADPESLAEAEFGEVAADVAAVVLELMPSAVVSYDERGGYGHPDHVRAHEAARRAADVYGIPFYEVLPSAVSPVGGPAPDVIVDVAVDVSPVLERKREALGAYRSQLQFDGDSIVLSGGQRQPIATVERFSRVPDTSAEPVAFSDQHPLARVLVSVLAGVIGVALGALLTVYNQLTVTIGGQPIWAGVILAIVVVGAVLTGFRLAFETRTVPAVAAVGMIVVVAIYSIPFSSGSPLITSSGPGLLWEFAPTVIAFVVLVWPRASRRQPGKIENQAQGFAGSVKGPQR
ncbi:MAG TPA: PIG-L family deacetylase [Galbitalea sp.]|nr:PIG-L family deacetylase [Galbitalea sp.]